MNIRDVQRLLAARGLYRGPIDGDAGPATIRAVTEILRRNGPDEWYGWPVSRQIIAAGQAALLLLGHQPGAIDGYAGRNTAEALTDFLSGHTAEVPRIPGPDYSPAEAQAAYPRQAEMEAFYGPAGGPLCTTGIVRLPLPFIIAWDRSQTITFFRCHARLADPMTAIFADTHAHYGGEVMTAMGLTTFGGCFNLRRMRGGKALSIHSWGAAVDLDPENNQLRWGRDRARFAAPDYDAFWSIVEAHGALSLGRAVNKDWMHYQFARL
jgi:hypothetical protein